MVVVYLIEGEVGDDICGVVFDDCVFCVGDKVGAIVFVLFWQDFKFIYFFGVVFKVEFVKYGGLVVCILQQLWEGYVGCIKRKMVVNFVIDVVVFVGKNDSMGRCIDGICYVGVGE